MLELQLKILTLWYSAADQVRYRLDEARRDERGEVTATTVIIVLLVTAAIAAGTVIAKKITDNADGVPSP